MNTILFVAEHIHCKEARLAVLPEQVRMSKCEILIIFDYIPFLD